MSPSFSIVDTADETREVRRVLALEMRFVEALRMRSDDCGRASPLAKTTTGEKARAMSAIEQSMRKCCPDEVETTQFDF